MTVPALAHFPNGSTIIVQTTTENVEIENVQFTEEHITSISNSDPVVKRKRKSVKVEDVTEKKSKLDKLGHKKLKKDKFIETVTAYKCKLCDFLGLAIEVVEEHLQREHEAEYLDSSDWLEVALKENIRLKCPQCQNSFVSEGSRSFKIHMMDDHGEDEENANVYFDLQNGLRRSQALQFMKEQREIQKIQKSALVNREMEAYVDIKGELRVRTIKSLVNDTDSDEELDVTAEKYFDVARGSSPVVAETPNPSTPPKNVSKRKTPAILSKKMGRPKGTKSVGISKLRSLNPNISMSEVVMGIPCQRDRCGKKLKGTNLSTE